LTLTQHSEISTVINNQGNHAAIVSNLKRTVKEAMVSLSFVQLQKAGANRVEMEQIVAVLILKYAHMLTVGGNLRPEHPMEYARQIIHDWPTMSLDDLNILLANGVKGRYNDKGVMRFDIAVLYDWIAKYQDEWSAEYERTMQKEKNKPINPIVATPETERLVDSFLEKLSDFNKVPKLTDEQLKELGREKRQKRGVTLARKKFVIEGMEVSADTEEEALKMYGAFKGTKK